MQHRTLIFSSIFSLIILSECVFSIQLLGTNYLFSSVLGIFHPFFLVGAITVMMRNFRRNQTTDYRRAFYAFGVVVALFVPALSFLLFGLSYWILDNSMLQLIGFSCSICVFLAILIGIFWGRWNWRVHPVELNFPNLPKDLHGLKIVQISDVHIGSFFNNYKRVEKAIDIINSLEADYVVFTGDLVNNITAEMHGWEKTFQRIQAKKGKYSILGNHDYGDYVPWESKEAKKQNILDLIEMNRTIGFTPLLNSSIQLSDTENGAYLLGVENWGTAPFRQSGKLDETLENIPDNAFKLLLSHDPSHFDEQVVGKQIDLTLSGHTHGMQFGIERFGIKFSPVQFRYKKWAGLYQTGKQFLYVNRGFGYIGFPGRVGIYPEITLLILNAE